MMTNLWAFLLQTLSVTLVGLLLLVIKQLLQDKLTPRWQYAVWTVLAARILLPVQAGSTYALLPLPLWVETVKTAVERHLTSAYTDLYAGVRISLPLPWVTGAPASVTDWLFLVYCAGVAVVLIRYLVTYRRLRRLLRRGNPAPEAVIDQVARVGETYGLAPCRVVVIPGLPSPMVCGLVHPVLALPEGKLVNNPVILHELLHIRHRDAWQNLFWCLCRALHWCNPVVHLLLNRVGNDLESLCDQRVLEKLAGEARRSYGLSLLAMANDQYPRAPGTTSISNGGKNIARRIEAIARFKAYPRGMALASVCVTVVLLGSCLLGTAKPSLDRLDSWNTAGFAEGGLDQAQSIAITHLTRCSTVAGALDTYAKGLMASNRLYLMMASPRETRQALEEACWQEGNLALPDPEELVQVYPIATDSGWPAAADPPQRRAVPYDVLSQDYGIYNLSLEADGSYTALLTLRADQHSMEPTWSSHSLLCCPVRVYWEEGYVVEPAGERSLYVAPQSEDTYYTLFDSLIDYSFLPPAKVYAAEENGDSVEIRVLQKTTVARETPETVDFFGMSTQSFSTVPEPDADFGETSRPYYIRYGFTGTQEERDTLIYLCVQVMAMSPGEASDFSEMDRFAADVETTSTASWSSNNSSSVVESIPPDWDGEILWGSGLTTDGSRQNLPFPENFAVRVLWNGQEHGILTAEEVTTP